MPDIYDLLSLCKVNPAAMKEILADAKKVAEFGLTSAQLEAIRTMEPDHIRVVVEAIDERLRIGPAAGTNACSGTFACHSSAPE